MGCGYTKLFYNKPFPVSAGDLNIYTQKRSKPAYGQSKIPHVPKIPTCYDVMGRIVIEDGLKRLRNRYPSMHIKVINTIILADFQFNMLLYDTDHLNIVMKKYNMLAFCIISHSKVMMLCNGDYDKICEKKKNAKYVIKNTKYANQYLSYEKRLVDEWLDNSKCITPEQLHKIITIMSYAYRKYGVGALVMTEDKFSYHIIVPNETEYAKHKDMYDKRERDLKINYDVSHANSKRTRSGKNFDRDLKCPRLS